MYTIEVYQTHEISCEDVLRRIFFFSCQHSSEIKVTLNLVLSVHYSNINIHICIHWNFLKR